MRIYKRDISLLIILVSAAAVLVWGWKTFWFLTDDAFIAFRYVSNSILGYGYTWNPPPFLPVEGYTSFLWVLILDIVWRVTGIEPPQSANYLSLGFSFGTLILIVFAILRMRLSNRLERYRPVLIAFALLGIVSNRSFLAWTSSGLETALFNFCLTLWVVAALFGNRSSFSRILGITISASLAYLSRPDGMLFVIASVVLVFLHLRSVRGGGAPDRKWPLAVLPLAIPPAHLIWRRITYGEWLPNTYYAKYVAPWPEAGVRYLYSFILEYSLWIWLLALAWLIFRWIRHKRIQKRKRKPISLSSCIVVGALTLHLAYYTLIIGGDHFEYRVYSYLIPLMFVSFIWMLNKLALKPAAAAAILGAFVIVSWLIPWTHWALTHDINDRESAHVLRMSVADRFPFPFSLYANAFDRQQSWLIERHICMRHQEHKVFWLDRIENYPERTFYPETQLGVNPVMRRSMVGVAGWVYPNIAIIDLYGLNDYVIARNRIPGGQKRLMAHERTAPDGYIESYQINTYMPGPRRIRVDRRETDLTDEKIAALEEYWRSKIKNKGDNE